MIDQMTLEEKIGQLFMFGFQDDAHLDVVLNDLKCGGLIYFKRNVEEASDALKYSNYIMENSTVVPFISIDQEGGIVNRITKGITHVPGQMAIAATENPYNAYVIADILSKEMGALGINMPLSPVLDVNNNPKNPIINVRSFGEVAKRVSEFAEEALKGYNDNSMIAVGKHFPGHGDTDMDSHLSLPIVLHDLERLNNVELIPYKDLIHKGLNAIMVSHIVFPSISKRVPATLSSGICTTLLRETLGFEGLILTDCMEMDAIDKHFDTGEAAFMSLKAGVDLVLISHTLEKQKCAVERVMKALESGEMSEDEIDQKVIRILKAKAEYLSDNRPISFDQVRHQKKSQDIFDASISVYKMGDLPIKSHSKILWVLPDSLMAKEFSGEKISFESFDLECFEKYDTIVMCTNNLKEPSQMEAFNKCDANKTIHVSLLSPYDLSDRFKTSICTYEQSDEALSALKKVLYGKIEACGVLPVTLEGGIQ